MKTKKLEVKMNKTIIGKRISWSLYFVALPSIIVFGGAISCFYFPYPLFDDYFDVKSYEKTYELFTLIVNSLVSLIGIYITVSLVAYEFFKQKTGIDIQKSFLINRPSTYFISFTVFTIICAFISSITISEINPTYNEVTVIYFNAILFIGLLLSLFIVAFNLFSSLRPEKLANKELLKINNDTIKIKIAGKTSIDEQTEYYENDALLKIENIVIALIAVKDVLKAIAIIRKVSMRVSNLIIDEENIEDKNHIIERLISFYIRIIDFSMSQPNNSPILKNIWLSIEDVYSVLIDRNESVEHFKPFHKNFFERFFNRLILANNEEIIFEGLKSLRRIIQNQIIYNLDKDLKTYPIDRLRQQIDSTYKPPEEYSSEDYDNQNHFEGIAHDLVDRFSYVMNKAVITNQPDLLNKCNEEIKELNFKFRLNNIGAEIQTYFYLKTITMVHSYAYNAFEKNVFNKGHDAKDLTPAIFVSMIEEKHPAARDILQKYCYLLIDLQKINKLDRWFLGGINIDSELTFNGELGHIAKRCAIKYKSGIEIENYLDDCVNTFEILKENYEKNPPTDLGLYLGIKTQFEDIIYWLKREKLYRRKIYRKLISLNSSFKSDEQMKSS